MTKEEFVKRIVVNGIGVDIGIDDYGQCYFFEYEKNGEKYSECCGTYNIFYIEYIYSVLDERYHELEKHVMLPDIFGELSDEQVPEWEKYQAEIADIYAEGWQDNEE